MLTGVRKQIQPRDPLIRLHRGIHRMDRQIWWPLKRQIEWQLAEQIWRQAEEELGN